MNALKKKTFGFIFTLLKQSLLKMKSVETLQPTPTFQTDNSASAFPFPTSK